jgi:lariat debranching enzyme
MVTFWKYYSGEAVAPIPTIFVHGNHEASNIYFMGFCGVVNFAGIRIAGYGGIYNKGNFHKGRFETCPLNEKTMRSLYHCREYEMFQLLQVSL